MMTESKGPTRSLVMRAGPSFKTQSPTFEVETE